MQPIQQQEQNKLDELPPVPEKRFFTIGEVSQLCAVKPHVLRYWEQEFKQINPSKRRGNRRYYSQKDVLIIRQIRELLYDKGFTIGGARQQLLHTTNVIIARTEKIVAEKEILDFAEQGESVIKNTVKQLEDLLAILDNGTSHFQA